MCLYLFCTFSWGAGGEQGGGDAKREGKEIRGYVLEFLYDIIYFVALFVCIGMDPKKKKVNCPVPPLFFLSFEFAFLLARMGSVYTYVFVGRDCKVKRPVGANERK